MKTAGELKEKGVPCAAAAAAAEVSRQTLVRWSARQGAGLALVMKPGPKKLERLDLDALKGDIAALGFGPKRTSGTGDLYRMFKNSISKRDLEALVDEARDGALDSRRASMQDVRWLKPRSVWGMDVTEADGEAGKIFACLIQDMASKYKFELLVTDGDPHGAEVAAHLERLFLEYGPPLILKRDNGKNLNSAGVDDVLARHMVIPLNSPCYYPKFNGSVENANSELKRGETFDLMRGIGASGGADTGLLAYKAVNEMNHKKRRALGGKCSCLAFLGSEKLKVTRRGRKEIYDEILDRIVEIERLECNLKRDTVTRSAIRSWLLENGHITVSGNREVLPGSRWQNVS
jgi:transposase InsO family protein